MSRERPRSLTPQGRASQRKHGLKVQTLPLPPELKSYDSVRTTQELEENGEPDEYRRNNPQSSFEKDEDFKFKRHKHRNNAGTASLGERLDSLHELQNARWVDNFNSSVNMDRRARNSQRENPSQESQRSIPALPAQSIPPSYMPYMYYYPFAPMVHPMSTSPRGPRTARCLSILVPRKGTLTHQHNHSCRPCRPCRPCRSQILS